MKKYINHEMDIIMFDLQDVFADIFGSDYDTNINDDFSIRPGLTDM